MELDGLLERYMQAYSKYIKTWNRINPDDDGLAMGELAAFNREISDAALEVGYDRGDLSGDIRNDNDSVLMCDEAFVTKISP